MTGADQLGQYCVPRQLSRCGLFHRRGARIRPTGWPSRFVDRRLRVAVRGSFRTSAGRPHRRFGASEAPASRGDSGVSFGTSSLRISPGRIYSGVFPGVRRITGRVSRSHADYRRDTVRDWPLRVFGPPQCAGRPHVHRVDVQRGQSDLGRAGQIRCASRAAGPNRWSSKRAGFAVFIITVAAAEIALGLGIVFAMYRNTESVDLTEATELRN